MGQLLLQSSSFAVSVTTVVDERLKVSTFALPTWAVLPDEEPAAGLGAAGGFGDGLGAGVGVGVGSGVGLGVGVGVASGEAETIGDGEVFEVKPDEFKTIDPRLIIAEVRTTMSEKIAGICFDYITFPKSFVFGKILNYS